MPIYEYLCSQCNRKFRKLVGMIANVSEPQCPHCHSIDLKRQISRFARLRTEDDTLDSLADEMESVDESSPAAMRRLVRAMGDEMGEDLTDEFEQSLEEGEHNSSDPIGL